jgi:hypothetical protein
MLASPRLSDRCEDQLGRPFFDCLFLSLEKIGVVITEARPPVTEGDYRGILEPRRVK